MNDIKKERILQVIGGMNRAGAETMLMNLYRVLDKTRMQFDFLVFTADKQDYEDEIEALGGRVIHFPCPPGPRMVKSIPYMRRLLKSGDYVAVHAHTLHNCAYAMIAAMGTGVRRISHSHNTSTNTGGCVGSIYKFLTERIIRVLSEEYLACGVNAGLYLFGKKFRKKGVVIKNCIDTERFIDVPPGEIAAIRSEYGLEGRIAMLSVARFNPEKNHGFMVETARRLQEDGVPFRMLLVGRGSLQESVEKKIEEYGLGSEVRLLGVRGDIPALMRACDIFLMPSLFEGNPVTLVEAQAAGMRCLVSDTVSPESAILEDRVSFLPIDKGVAPWVKAITDSHNARPSSETIRCGMKKAGYDLCESLRRLTAIYTKRNR